jgi:hypothetical protein
MDKELKKSLLVTAICCAVFLFGYDVIFAFLHHDFQGLPKALLFNCGPIILTLGFCAFVWSKKAQTQVAIYFLTGGAVIFIAMLFWMTRNIQATAIMGSSGIGLIIIGVYLKYRAASDRSSNE